MTKQIIAIEKGTGDYYIVDDIRVLIEEMYGVYNDSTIESFYNIHYVLKVDGIVQDISRC